MVLLFIVVLLYIVAWGWYCVLSGRLGFMLWWFAICYCVAVVGLRVDCGCGGVLLCVVVAVTCGLLRCCGVLLVCVVLIFGFGLLFIRDCLLRCC